MDPFDYLVHETERQSGTMKEAIGFYRSWSLMCRWAATDKYYRKSFNRLIPNLVYLLNGVEGYRNVPAVFNQGMPALDAELVPHAMKRLCDAMDERDQDQSVTDRQRADLYTREFLLIHPFTDGNGRVGSLIWNYWMSTLDAPEPMPYFFGEDSE